MNTSPSRYAYRHRHIFQENHMNTMRLRFDYLRLHNDLAANGPSPEFRKSRAALNTILRMYRAEQRYAQLKAETGIVIECLEPNRPLTATDAHNLTAASTVNQEITRQLRELRHGRKRAGGAKTITGHRPGREAVQHQ